MAADIYLHIEGIAGESSDSTHKGWIQCQSVEWEVVQPKSATASTAGGHTAERCMHRNIVVRKLSDLATPLLLQHCATGRTLPRAKFEFFRADSGGHRVKYFEVRLENVVIGDIAPEIHAGAGQPRRLLPRTGLGWDLRHRSMAGHGEQAQDLEALHPSAREG